MKPLFRSLNILKAVSPGLIENVFNSRFCTKTAFKVIEPTCYRKLPETLNPINHGEGAKLPDAYKKFFTEWKLTEPLPVHYTKREGRWERDPVTEEIKRIYDQPIRGYVSRELHGTLSGGETIIQGYTRKGNPKKPRAPKHRIPRFWVPVVKKSVVYSEILNKHMSVLMTHRVIKLIHEHEGFDNYILQTRACDLSTRLAVSFKRVLLMALHKKDFPYDEEKNQIIYEKYKKYLIPPEEIEWYGLTYHEALSRMKKLEEKAMIENTKPLKEIYRQQLVEYLQNPPVDDFIEEAPQGFKDKVTSKFSQFFRRKSGK